MRPRQKLALLYATGAYGHSDTFESDILVHRHTGHVLDTDEYFIAWRNVGMAWPLNLMREPRLAEPGSDCVWVWALAGDMRKAVEAALAISPDVKWAGWDRRGQPKFVNLAKVLGIKDLQSPDSPAS